jgi:hypothetical protein
MIGKKLYTLSVACPQGERVVGYYDNSNSAIMNAHTIMINSGRKWELVGSVVEWPRMYVCELPEHTINIEVSPLNTGGIVTPNWWDNVINQKM